MSIIVQQAATAQKFADPDITASGAARARVELQALQTVWFNTGTLCNLTCSHCYIESSPSNNRLVYLTRREVAGYLQEIAANHLPVQEIGFTGGEPFMNPHIISMLEDCLASGVRVLVLTNAMRPMLQHAAGLQQLLRRYAQQLCVRVSVDHYARELHQQERGRGSWAPMMRGLRWLSEHGFNLQIAGRMFSGESEQQMRRGYAGLFARHGIALDADDVHTLVLFPEMDEQADVPEITTRCWSQLQVNPADMMCASGRMVVKRRGALAPEVVACTLLPYQRQFAYGSTLVSSLQPVSLNHPHCARFCVLGGGRCTG